MFDGLVAISRTYDSTEVSRLLLRLGRWSLRTAHYHSQITGRFDQELIDSLPASLRYICHCGAGYDSVDAEACAQRGMPSQTSLHLASDVNAF